MISYISIGETVDQPVEYQLPYLSSISFNHHQQQHQYQADDHYHQEEGDIQETTLLTIRSISSSSISSMIMVISSIRLMMMIIIRRTEVDSRPISQRQLKARQMGRPAFSPTWQPFIRFILRCYQLYISYIWLAFSPTIYSRTLQPFQRFILQYILPYCKLFNRIYQVGRLTFSPTWKPFTIVYITLYSPIVQCYIIASFSTIYESSANGPAYFFSKLFKGLYYDVSSFIYWIRNMRFKQTCGFCHLSQPLFRTSCCGINVM